MVKMLTVGKNARNKFAKYNYRTIDDILAAVADSGQSVILSDDVREIGGHLFVEATATSGEQSAKALAEIAEHKGMSAEQATGAASTYARKYALAGLFAIATGDDPDERSNSETESSRSTSVAVASEKQIALIKSKASQEQLLWIEQNGGFEKITKEIATKLIEKIINKQ